jgi:hypothetical protein
LSIKSRLPPRQSLIRVYLVLAAIARAYPDIDGRGNVSMGSLEKMVLGPLR